MLPAAESEGAGVELDLVEDVADDGAAVLATHPVVDVVVKVVLKVTKVVSSNKSKICAGVMRICKGEKYA